MQASTNCERRHDIDVYLNGKKLNDCIQADDIKGVAWVMYRDSKGKLVSEIDAEPGALFYEGAQVIKLNGKIEIKVRIEEGESEAHVREVIEKTSAPIRLYFYAE